jgi:hypothetical protein
MSALEREDYLGSLEFASPAFIEAVLKAYRMADQGVTTPRGKIITNEQGRPVRLGAPEAAAQAMGFRPERLARISGEHWTMENVRGARGSGHVQVVFEPTSRSIHLRSTY